MNEFLDTEEPEAASNREFLTFVLGNDEYGIERRKVREVRGYGPVTAIADAPAYVKGTTELVGVSAPIVDLRMWFNVGRVNYGPITAVIVLHSSERVAGLVVDRVSDIIVLAPAQVHPARSTVTRLKPDYLIGLGMADERAIVLLDIDKLMAAAVPDLYL